MMSTPNTPRTPAPPGARPPATGPGFSGGLPPLDPIRLFKKYWGLIAGAAVIGAVLGAATHFAWMRVWPMYRAHAIFECSAPDRGPGILDQRFDDQELERFMQTQAARMLSDRVLFQATRNPQFDQEVPIWSSRFKRGGRFSPTEAAHELQDSLRARVIPGTYFVRLTMTWKEKEEAASIVRFVREAYQADLRNVGNIHSRDQEQALTRSIDGITERLLNKQRERETLLAETGADTLEARTSEARVRLDMINARLMDLRSQSGDIRLRLAEYEAQLRAGGPVVYPDDIAAAVAENPSVVRIQQEINTLLSSRAALLDQGAGPSHRTVRSINAQIDAKQRILADERERIARSQFESFIKRLRDAIRSIEAEELELLEEREHLQVRLNELARLQGQLEDVERDIEGLMAQRDQFETRRGDLGALQFSPYADRVILQQQEQVPTEAFFPKLYILVPLGMFLFVGLVGTGVAAREVLDQRVKGPSDVALIPRARVVGVIPHAGEDPTSPEHPETAFRDQPRGVVSESIRQTRAAVMRRMEEAGHKTLLVTPVMPGSGGSTLAANLALAAAFSDKKVLIIDANLRRPSQHRIFDQPEAPGLADILAGECSLEKVSRPSGQANLTLMPAGSPEKRVYERLASERMSSLIQEAALKFDLVVIDTAPALISGDAQALAARCDASLLVVRAFSEKRGMVARVRAALEDQNAQLLGVVINAVRSSAGGYLRRNIRAAHEYQKPVE